MKKSLVVFVFAFLLFATFVVGASNSSIANSFNAKELPILAQEKTASAFNKEIAIPYFLQTPASILFGIEIGGTVTIERIIVLLAIFITIFLLIRETLEATPFFNGNLIKFFMGIVITILVAMTGAINSLAIFFFNLGNSFEWLEVLGPFQIFIALAIAGVVIFMGHYVSRKIADTIKMAEAKSSGKDIGRLVATAKTSRESTKELSK